MSAISAKFVTSPIIFRDASEADVPAICEIFQETLKAGGTYTLPSDYPSDKCREYWMGPEMQGKGKYYATRVATLADRVVGMYAIRPCYSIDGPSAHVANASYIVGKEARGQGIAPKMGNESLELAKKMGYTKMQYNQVVSTNTVAVKIWMSLGFTEVGRSPGAFKLADGTEADLLILNKTL